MFGKGLQIFVADFVTALGTNLNAPLFRITNHTDFKNLLPCVPLEARFAKGQFAFCVVFDIDGCLS